MKKLKLLLLLCLTFSLPANGMQLPSLTACIEKITTPSVSAGITFFIGILYGIYQIIKVSKIPLEDENIKNFITDLITQRNYTENDIDIYVLNDEKYKDTRNILMALELLGKKILLIGQADIKELQYIIKNNTMPTIKNKYSGIIHHELTHLERYASTRKVAYLTAGSALSSIVSSHLFNLFEKHTKKTYNNSLKYIFFAMGQILNYTFTSCIVRQYEEIKADDGVPNNPVFLQPLAQIHKEAHRLKIEDINRRKEYLSLLAAYKNEKYYSLIQLCAMRTFSTESFKQSSLLREMVFDPTHPSDKFRAKKFKARIAAIEDAEKSAQNK